LERRTLIDSIEQFEVNLTQLDYLINPEIGPEIYQLQMAGLSQEFGVLFMLCRRQYQFTYKSRDDEFFEICQKLIRSCRPIYFPNFKHFDNNMHVYKGDTQNIRLLG
jgi:hypothetical protein